MLYSARAADLSPEDLDSHKIWLELDYSVTSLGKILEQPQNSDRPYMATQQEILIIMPRRWNDKVSAK